VWVDAFDATQNAAAAAATPTVLRGGANLLLNSDVAGR
jgi:hypothetical protein